MKTPDPHMNSNIQNFIEDLKKKDREYKQMMRFSEWFSWVLAGGMVVLHAILLCFPGQEGSLTRDIYTGVSFVLAFMIYALFFRSYKKDYEKMDYSLPALQMLKKTVEKQKIYHPRLWLLVIPSLIIGYNVSHSFTRHISVGLFQNEAANVYFVMACFLLLMVVSAFFGYASQRKVQREYSKRAHTLIKEITD